MSTARVLANADDFNRNDAEDLGTNWTSLTTGSGDGPPRIRNNALTGGAGTVGAAARWTGAGTFTNDHWSSLALAAVSNAGAGKMMGVIGRASAGVDSARDYYLYQVLMDSSGPQTTNLCRVDNSVLTVLATSRVAWTNGDRIEIECVGSTINGLKNGVVQHTVTDTTYATGIPGVGPNSYDGTTVLGDDWQGGSLITVSDLPMTPGPAGVGTISGTLLGVTSLSVTMAGVGTLGQVSNIQITSSHMVGTGALSGPLQYFTNSTCHMYGGWSMGNVTLGWNANTESDLAGYKIYIGTSSGIYNYATSPYVSPVNVGMVQTFTFILLPGGVTYYFAITAFNSTGQESAFSSELAVPIETYHAYSMTLTGTNVITGAASGTSQLLGNLINVGGLILNMSLGSEGGVGGLGELKAFGLANKAGAMSAFPNLGAMASSSMTLTGTGALIRSSQGQSAGALTGTLQGTQGLTIPGSAAGSSVMTGTLAAVGYMSIMITGQGVMSIHSFTQVGTPQKQYRTKLQAGEVHSSPKR